MKKISISVFFVIGIIWTIFSCCGFAQEIGANTGEPLPPPVNIEFTVENIPIVGKEAVLKLKVTPIKDMHVDISCLLPEGIEPVREQGIIVRPCMDRYPSHEQTHARYMEAIELWVGPLEAGIPKEFVFRVIIPDKERYEFIAIVEALAKWGIKEEILVIDLN